MQPNAYLLDTDAGHDIVNSKLIQSDWKHKEKSQVTPELQSQIKESITLLETMLFFVQTKSLHVEHWFGTFKDMAADTLSDIPFIDRKWYCVTRTRYLSLPSQRRLGNDAYRSLSRLEAEIHTISF